MFLKKISIREKNLITKIHIFTGLNIKSISSAIGLLIGISIIYNFRTNRHTFEYAIIGLLIIFFLVESIMIISNESITIHSDQIVINRKVLFFIYQTEKYELQFVRNMYVKKKKRLEILTYKRMSEKYDYMSSISFEYMGKTHEFGRGIDFIEGKHLIDSKFRKYSLRS